VGIEHAKIVGLGLKHHTGSSFGLIVDNHDSDLLNCLKVNGITFLQTSTNFGFEPFHIIPIAK